MTWTQRTAEIQIGDRVCFSKRFLQSTGQLTGEMPSARGVVKAIHPMGTTRLALIDWTDPDLPNRVAVANLSRNTEKGIQELP